MFNIAMDESGATCNSHELVKDKSESDVGNAKKRKYFCVTCQDGKHPVFLKIRHKIQKVSTKARNYKSAAWFSHHGKTCEGENSGGSKRDNPCPETALHWQAKHVLCKDVGRYSYVTSRCTGCGHEHVENGAGACARVEHVEKKPDGNHYRFDAVLMRGDTVSSVMEVWATHETGELKREYCIDMGFTFSEFDARHVLDAHDNALEGEHYELENLKIRLFECQGCINKELYYKTCTGAETHIIQLQESLYANYCDKIWRGHKFVGLKQHGIESASALADGIKRGVVKHNWTQFEGDISFKCFCGKWVREDQSEPACRRMYWCERNKQSFEQLRNEKNVRTYKSVPPNDIHVKICGLCSVACVVCNETILLRTAVATGCCHACDSAHKDDDEISRSLNADITRIHTGDEFRGFLDFAIEYRPIFLAQYAARRCKMECDENKIKQQVRRVNKRKKRHEMYIKMMRGAGSEESRFAEFMIDRRKQIESVDKAVQIWKAKNPAAWDKKELWQQQRDREIAAAVYRRGLPNPCPDFV
jgi:hypothetical protein